MVKRKSRDMFFVDVTEAALACAAVADFKVFTGQMADLLDKLSDWVKLRRDRLKGAHLTLRQNHRSVLFVIMQKDIPFDAELSDELTDLDIEVANDEAFKLLTLDVLAIPAVSRESANAFLSSGKAYTHAH